MFLDHNNSQIGIELACRKPICSMTKREWQIKFIWWTVIEISETKFSKGRLICLTLLAIGVCVFVEKRSHRRVPTG